MDAFFFFWLFLAYLAPVFSAVDVAAAFPIDSSFNTSAATLASFSSFDAAIATPELFSFDTSVIAPELFSFFEASDDTPELFSSVIMSAATPTLYSLFIASVTTPELFSLFNASADTLKSSSSFSASADTLESYSLYDTPAATLELISLLNASAATPEPYSLLNVSAATPALYSSFNSSIATPESYSSVNASVNTLELISSVNASATASAPIVLFYIIRPSPTCLVVDTDFDPDSAAEICEAMANPPPMVKKGSFAQIGQTVTMLHKHIQDFIAQPSNAPGKVLVVEATDNADQAEYAPVTVYIATAAQIAELDVANKEELLDSNMVQVAQSDAPVLAAKHKRVFRGKLKTKLRSVGKATKSAIMFRHARHAK
ncbi:hypothetical protein GGH96_003632 [Coemansia sp. RSA 1972]|nr:hypothetical protein GGH96_003632 [Coemansia sp. RSA 1972]